jgi:hypothetical protein
MKIKFCWVALLASAAMIAQANAGGHHGGGGGDVSAGSFSRPSDSGRSATVSPNHAIPSHISGARGPIYSRERFAPAAIRSLPSASVHRYYVPWHANAGMGGREFRRNNVTRDNELARSSIRNRTGLNTRSTGVAASPLKNGSSILRSDWRSHVFAERVASWQRNWDRRTDHWWRGHRCHFVNGSWIIFDLGFYPWDTFWYPYGNYYGYGYYPYSYSSDPGYYDSDVYDDQPYYRQNNDDVTVQSADSIVANAQEQLARQGYYHGKIDGILGRETSRAIARFQSEQGLRVTGVLTHDTIDALGLRRVASY